jgi:hypothetical protein
MTLSCYGNTSKKLLCWCTFDLREREVGHYMVHCHCGLLQATCLQQQTSNFAFVSQLWMISSDLQVSEEAMTATYMVNKGHMTQFNVKLTKFWKSCLPYCVLLFMYSREKKLFNLLLAVGSCLGSFYINLAESRQCDIRQCNYLIHRFY